MKNSIIIISIMLILLLFLILNFRNLSMSCCNTDHLIDRYSSLKKIDSPEKVVISLSLDDNSLGKVKRTINSLLDQSVKVDNIVVNYYSLKPVPSFIQNTSNVYKQCVDYKAANNFLPTMLRTRKSNTIIIFLKSGSVYPRKLVENLVKKSRKEPRTLFQGKDFYLTKPSFYDSSIADKIYSDRSQPQLENLKSDVIVN